MQLDLTVSRGGKKKKSFDRTISGIKTQLDPAASKSGNMSARAVDFAVSS